MDFAQRLKELRKKKGMSQAKIAELIDVHFTQISRYERGDTKPNAEPMAKLAKVLDTTVDYLMTGSTEDIIIDSGLNKELITRFKQLKDFNSEDKKTVLSLMDAFIAKTKIQSFLQVKS